MISFFRKLFGSSAEQSRESERFLENLRRMDAKGEELLVLQGQLRGIQERTEARAAEYERVAQSMSPPPLQAKEPDDERSDSQEVPLEG